MATRIRPHTHRSGMIAMSMLAASLAACATRTASVDHRMLMPDGERHAVDRAEFFVMPMALASPNPAFPDADAVGRREVTACAEVWLSEDGDVVRVAPFTAPPECADGADPNAQPYVNAVIDAMRQWEFTPAMICSFPPQLQDKRERGDCTGPEVTVRRVPVRLNYAFTFSVRDGRRRIGIARGPTTDRAPTEAVPR